MHAPMAIEQCVAECGNAYNEKTLLVLGWTIIMVTPQPQVEGHNFMKPELI